ncbi:hypothetical protein H4R18_003629 [Coemansia javaensis]|uniref:Pre-mRNA-splicing factor SPF27 n=1 Tax=Coemansia javaensis TaxID=2761396 RepID=A0A9W8H6H2_9FUNG|nr:hypothetical protein H4R18_003629 [Coemansia javaensis]
MSGRDVALDSLPYVDKEYDDPAVREQVLALIQEEMGRVAAPAMPRGQRAPGFGGSALLQKEYERVRGGDALPAFDVERYKLTAPGSDGDGDVDAWRRAADNAAAQLEHQGARQENLELLQRFGANAWRLGNYQKEALLRSIEAATQRCRSEGMDANRARKREQTEAAARLRDLEARWSEGVRQCVEIQVASDQLRREIEELEK